MISSYQLIPKYFLGEGCLSELGKILKKSKYHNILLLYGGQSIHKNGIYNQIKEQLDNLNNINVFEFSGIEPNPRTTTIDQAVNFCRKNKIDLILATGGGSVIDAAKVIGVLTANEQIQYSWDYVLNSKLATHDSIDIYAILTIAGTGSENNSASVITNWQENIKIPVFSPSAIPKVTFLDPTFTYSVPLWQLSSGIFDNFSHLLEQYFGKHIFMWTENIIFANLKTLLNVINVLYTNDLYDYEARKNQMWNASMSLNTTTSFSSETDWNVHAIEHSISAKWDITHGAGLALITPTYIKIRANEEQWFAQKAIKLANEIFGVNTIDALVAEIKRIISLLKLPLKYNDFEQLKNINNDDIDFIINHTLAYGSTLSKPLITKIVNAIFNK